MQNQYFSRIDWSGEFLVIFLPSLLQIQSINSKVMLESSVFTPHLTLFRFCNITILSTFQSTKMVVSYSFCLEFFYLSGKF
jgi:hypothetical protein